jgi:hypothetical protein
VPFLFRFRITLFVVTLLTEPLVYSERKLLNLEQDRDSRISCVPPRPSKSENVVCLRDYILPFISKTGSTGDSSYTVIVARIDRTRRLPTCR